MSERDGFVERLSAEEARAEVVRLDGLLKAEQQARLEERAGATRTIWLILWSLPTHQVKVMREAQEAYGEGRPLLDRRDDPRDGCSVFTARSLP